MYWMGEVRIAIIIFSLLALPLIGLLGWKNFDIARIEAEVARQSALTTSRNEAALKAALEANGGPVYRSTLFRKRDIQHGLFVGRYSELGYLEFISPREDFKKHGVEQHFYENGNLFWSVPYVNGKKHGLYMEYHADGKTPFEEKSYVMGKAQGEILRYYDDGVLKKRLRMMDGKKNGQSIFYRPDGSVESKVPYTDGERHGSQVLFDPSGEICGTIEWHMGIKHGEEIIYNEDGTVSGRQWVDGESSRIYLKQM